MKIGVLNETAHRGVSIAPPTLKKNPALATHFVVEHGAGTSAGFADAEYATWASLATRTEILTTCDIIISTQAIAESEMQQLKKQAIYITQFAPYNNADIIGTLEKHQLRAFSLDMIPRSSIAQSMDVLSSMASIAGYKAVLLAANQLDRYFPMMMTAAGTIRPARVLVLGAGVAGLQAIATARKLGATVEAFDVRRASKEEVESLGAKFVEVEGAADDSTAGGYAVEQSADFIKKQKQEVQARAIKADVIITTAQLRGKTAPILVEKETVEKMTSGSVIVDLAASTGGNCALTQNDETIYHNEVCIVGNSQLFWDMPKDASTLYSNNVMNFLKLIVNEKGEEILDMENDILKASLITTYGK